MSFDPTSTHVLVPDPIRIAMLRQELLPLLQERLSHISPDQVRSMDVLLYLALYLEHRVEGEKQGAVRKELLTELMRQYYATPELEALLGAQIDFVCQQHLVKKNGIVRRFLKILLGWLRFKLRV